MEELKWTPARLRLIARCLRHSSPESILRWGLEYFGRGLCLATSFGPQSIVLMHVISRLQPSTTVFYLDTELLFPETYRLRDELAGRLDLRFTRVTSELTVEQQAERHGGSMWSRDPDLCCRLRKVLPLRRFLADKRAWITGVRAGHTPARAGADVVEWDKPNGLVKLNPLLRWTHDEVWDYIGTHDLPANPLHEQGYPSIGCRPCTRPVAPGQDARSGRWAGFEKTECGIHRSGEIS